MKHRYNKTMQCPCHSDKQYKVCCQPFHLGKIPDTALQLMRSRFAAYALSLSQYIIDTTHPENPQFSNDILTWTQEIANFSSHTEFKDLKILEFEENTHFATVTFFAHLIQNKKDVSFTEKSYFEKIDNRWLYRSGEIYPNKLTLRTF